MVEAAGFGIMSLVRGVCGVLSVVLISYLLSYDRKHIDWKLVGGGLFLEIVLALSILYVPIVGNIFKSFGIIFVKIMDFTNAGLEFCWVRMPTKRRGSVFCYTPCRSLSSSLRWFPSSIIGASSSGLSVASRGCFVK